MTSNIIWSGVVTQQNIADVFSQLQKSLGEKRIYTMNQQILGSSRKPKIHVYQKLKDLIIEKMIGFSKISIKDSVGELILIRAYDSKKNDQFPFIEISTNGIVINNLTPKGQKETIIFVLQPC